MPFGMKPSLALLGTVLALLDGNTWRDGPHVDRETLVGDVNLGFAQMWKRTRLTAAYTVRSREFSTQGNGLQYGSIAMAFRF